MLQNASNRIREAWNKYSLQCSLTEFFFDKGNNAIVPEHLREVIKYTQGHWKKDKKYRYIIWGITQTAESLYKYIQNEYSNAILVGVIDVYRKMNFNGMETQGIEFLDIDKDAVVFVAAESINAMALKVFRDKEIKDYVLCWKNHDYKMTDDNCGETL